MGKRQDSPEELLRGLLNHPGWNLLEEKTKIIYDNADRRLHQVGKDQFEETKGFYLGVQIFHDLIIRNPKGILDVQGITKVKGA